jgi:hypothetical protein
MKKIFILLIAAFFVNVTVAQDTMAELKNSIERAEGGSGASVVYSIHLKTTTVRSYYAKNYSKGTLIEENGKPVYFELSKTVGEEKESVVINIESASIIELEVTYVKGKCHYKFDFYY